MTPRAMEAWLISYKHGEIGTKEVFAAFEQYYNSQHDGTPIVSGSLPPDVTIKDILQIRNYFGEHDATLFEHRAFAILNRIVEHLEAVGGNDR